MLEEKQIRLRQPTCSFGGLLALFLEMYLFIMLYKQFSSGYYQTILMRGATISSYILPRILCDFIMCLLFFESLWLTNAIYGLNTDGW